MRSLIPDSVTSPIHEEAATKDEMLALKYFLEEMSYR